MIEVLYRRMTEEDAKEVAQIEADNFSIPWSYKSLCEAATKDGCIYVVAQSKGRIVGYAGAWGVLGEADITNVCVDKEYRRKHIAQGLINYLIDEGMKENIDIYFLEVRESNLPAINCYKSLGFENIGIRKNFYERPVENAIVMSKMMNK